MRQIPFHHRGLASAVVLTLVAALVPATSHAHPGDVTAAGFLAGVQHPWTGLDHMAVMLAVGLWAALMRNHSMAVLLGATAVGIGAGAFLGAYPDILTLGEQLTVASVIVIGLFASVAGYARKPLTAILVALFCLFHGHVHALETPGQFSQLAYSGGFLISMLALQLLGTAIASSFSRRPIVARGAGACCAAAGLVLLIAG